MGWREWSQSLWDRWGSKLQGRYDRINEMKLPDNVDRILKDVVSNLPEKIVSVIMAYVTKLYRSEGRSSVEKFVKNLLKTFK